MSRMLSRRFPWECSLQRENRSTKSEKFVKCDPKSCSSLLSPSSCNPSTWRVTNHQNGSTYQLACSQRDPVSSGQLIRRFQWEWSLQRKNTSTKSEKIVKCDPKSCGCLRSRSLLSEGSLKIETTKTALRTS